MNVEEAIEDILTHHGTKGMKWGVRKASTSPSGKGVQNLKPSGTTIGRDGSVSIKKGANIQRLTSDKFSRPMKDMTYASINELDNARYIKLIGGQGLLGGKRDTILSIKTTKPIKAPSFEESVKIHSELMIKNSEFRNSNTSPVGRHVSSFELSRIKKDPTGHTAKAWYNHANQNLTYTTKDYPEMAPMQKHFRQSFQAKGFDAVRDENDFRGGLSTAPVIIFSPEKTLRVVKTTQITDDIRKANKQTLKSYKRNGKKWIESELYGE